MRKLLLLLPIVFLVGCVATPVKRNFPEAPPELKETCSDLQQTNDTKKLSDVLTVVTENYSKYYECQIKVETWNDWYNTQKQIFDSVK